MSKETSDSIVPEPVKASLTTCCTALADSAESIGVVAKVVKVAGLGVLAQTIKVCAKTGVTQKQIEGVQKLALAAKGI